jgi:hypothetical protein
VTDQPGHTVAACHCSTLSDPSKATSAARSVGNRCVTATTPESMGAIVRPRPPRAANRPSPPNHRFRNTLVTVKEPLLMDGNALIATPQPSMR